MKTESETPPQTGLQIDKRYRFKCAEVTELNSLWRDQ